MMADTQLTANDICALSREELFELFKTLSAPSPAEMNGEFNGLIPEYLRGEWYPAIDALGFGAWLGKSYKADGASGEGCNVFRTAAGAIDRLVPFTWVIETSKFDGGPSLVMYYRGFDNWAADNDLTDEIRKVSDNMFLGLYHTKAPVPGFTPREGGERSDIEYFVLANSIKL